jgi:hypothetical protein
MNDQEALNIFHSIKSEYDSLPPPKYRHANLDDLELQAARLNEIKTYLKDNIAYARLVNAISQTIKRLTPSESWNNTSERGINKAIPPVIKKGGKRDGEMQFPFQWEDKHSGKICSISGYWNAKHFMVMDVLSYIFLLKTGGNCLPKEVSPIFEDLESIEHRENEINENLPNPRIPSKVTQEDIPLIKKQKYCVHFDDQDFRKFTNKEMTSSDILNLLKETSGVEFCISFPVLLFRGNKKDARQNWYNMNVFSRLFELASIDVDVRKDGIVQKREYYVIFNTILGELFVHNLLSRNYDCVSTDLYNLPPSAQIFYRRFLVHHNFPVTQLNLETIVQEMNFIDTNRTNLVNVVEGNILEPLKQSKLILSYNKKEDGLLGVKYEIRLPKKQVKELQQAQSTDIGLEDAGFGKDGSGVR